MSTKVSHIDLQDVCENELNPFNNDDIDPLLWAPSALLEQGGPTLLTQEASMPALRPPENAALQNPTLTIDGIHITQLDLDRCLSGNVLNDNVLDLAFEFLARSEPGLQARVKIFSCNWFRKQKDNNALHWYSRESISKREFVFIPTNLHDHWRLILVHNLPALMCDVFAATTSADTNFGLYIFDSLRCRHREDIAYIREYLVERCSKEAVESWGAIHVPETLASRLRNVKPVMLQLPKQDNNVDCGIFLLHYLDMFCDPVVLDNFARDPSFKRIPDWFTPSDIVNKRKFLADMILEMDQLTVSNSSTFNSWDALIKKFGCSHSSGVSLAETVLPTRGVQRSSSKISPEKRSFRQLHLPHLTRGDSEKPLHSAAASPSSSSCLTMQDTSHPTHQHTSVVSMAGAFRQSAFTLSRKQRTTSSDTPCIDLKKKVAGPKKRKTKIPPFQMNLRNRSNPSFRTLFSVLGANSSTTSGRMTLSSAQHSAAVGADLTIGSELSDQMKATQEQMEIDVDEEPDTAVCTFPSDHNQNSRR